MAPGRLATPLSLLGYADPSAKVNEFTPDRLPLKEFVRYVGKLAE